MEQMLLQIYYTNPLVNEDFPDPSIIQIKGEGYYAYATHDVFSPTINNILVKHSWDLVHWSGSEGALMLPPVWAKTCERFWCPQVVKVSDEFRLYFAAEPDTKDGMCLALAFSDHSAAFIDCGQPLSRLKGSTYQMIDPFFFIDPISGKHLLYYGSAHEAIKVVELAGDGKTFITEPVDVLDPGEGRFQYLREGAFITYNETWKRYFLWVSGDNTWEEESYAVSLFWSPDPVCGFIEIPGEHVILQPNAHWDSPGQNCVIKDEAGDEWMIYHAVDTKDRFITGTNVVKRKMCMDKILYTNDGWPYVNNGSPSYESQQGPAVQKRL